MFQKGTHFGRDHRPFDLLPWTRVAATRDLPTNRLFPGRRCCSDVAYLSQAFSQHTGPGAIMDKSGRHFAGPDIWCKGITINPVRSQRKPLGIQATTIETRHV
jgi:hypothetical protein